MKTEKICGSTLDRAEIIVDYRKTGDDRIQIKGIPEETKSNIVKSAIKEWMFLFAPYFLITTAIMVILLLIGQDFDSFNVIHNEKEFWIFVGLGFFSWIVLSGICGLFHLNKKFDKKWRKWFVLRTESKEKNRAVFSNFKSKVFTIYDFGNVVLNYDTKGDVKKQLYMVWIKEEPYSAIYKNQATIKKLSFTDDKGTKWNAYFFFEEIPKDGELCLEWI